MCKALDKRVEHSFGRGRRNMSTTWRVHHQFYIYLCYNVPETFEAGICETSFSSVIVDN